MKRLWTGLALAAGIALDAGASGDFGPSYTMFKAWTAPDIAQDRFQAGELGVLQPGMRRVYLYTAWRALSLGPAVAGAPGAAGGLARADSSAFANGWIDASDAVYQPLVTRAAALLAIPANDFKRRTILACAPAATRFALATFNGAAARPDATPARLDAWVLAQYQVGEACQVADDWRYRSGLNPAPDLVAPAAPAATEPLYWRQLNDYQRAAWAFRAGRYADSVAQFERIGATPGHPMHDLGAYLALRAEVRGALGGDVGKIAAALRERQARQLERRGDAILADPALAAMHEPTRALLRAMRASLTPEVRLQQLDRDLDDVAADPFAQDRLGDWSVLMGRARPAEVQALRADRAFVDWIETVRGCTGLAPNPACPAAGAHALDRWQATHARPWLVAALMLADGGGGGGAEADAGRAVPAALLQAGMALAPDDPGYVTVRYHLARLNRLAGRPDAARAIADEVLQRRLSPGTRNLLREERFAVATSVPDAARYLLRTNVDAAKAEQGRSDLPQSGETMINDDGLAWVNTGLPLADLVELAGQPALPQPLRARIAGAAWIRAALLGDVDDGRRAGALLAQLASVTAPAVARYAQAGTDVERRHIVLAESVRTGLAAQVGMDAQPVRAVAPADATASGWCSFKDSARTTPLPAEFATPGFGWRFPAAPDTGHADARRAQMARLGALQTSTGVFGADVLAWAASHPRDPALPWLLHVAVMSTRGGCLDPDAGAMSRQAWRLLHARYPGSAWTGRTPYHY